MANVRVESEVDVARLTVEVAHEDPGGVLVVRGRPRWGRGGAAAGQETRRPRPADRIAHRSFQDRLIFRTPRSRRFGVGRFHLAAAATGRLGLGLQHDHLVADDDPQVRGGPRAFSRASPIGTSLPEPVIGVSGSIFPWIRPLGSTRRSRCSLLEERGDLRQRGLVELIGELRLLQLPLDPRGTFDLALLVCALADRSPWLARDDVSLGPDFHREADGVQQQFEGAAERDLAADREGDLGLRPAGAT